MVSEQKEIRERALPDSVVNRAIDIIIEKNLEVFRELERIDKAGGVAVRPLTREEK